MKRKYRISQKKEYCNVQSCEQGDAKFEMQFFFYYGIFALKKSLHSKFILINEPHQHFISIWKSYLSRVALSSNFLCNLILDLGTKFVKFDHFSKIQILAIWQHCKEKYLLQLHLLGYQPRHSSSMVHD